MAGGAVTWEVREGRAFWAGRRLEEWLPVVIHDLVREFDPVQVWLFGSVARGADDGDSDVDVLVVLDRYKPASAIELKRRAARAVGAPVPLDVAFADPARFRRRARVAGSVERAAATEGRVVYQRA